MNELKLSKEIYNYGLVKMAVKEFAGISNIVVNIEENFLRCVFTNCIYDVEITLKKSFSHRNNSCYIENFRL